jgi:thiamine kinase-like enzyme
MNIGKLIGVGNTANVYEWEEDKVLKLFHEGYPDVAINMEYTNAIAIRELEFLKPKAYNFISYDNRKGIIYDRLRGESLLDWTIRTGNMPLCAYYMSKLHKEIIQNEVHDVPNYKDFLRYHIPSSLSLDKRKELLHSIDNLADGNTLCHGDFHPGNIIMSQGHMYAIDFMNVCYGNYIYDVARTVFLLEYTPVPLEAPNRDMIIQFKKALADLYLILMGVNRDMIKDYLTVIIAVRKGECPDE